MHADRCGRGSRSGSWELLPDLAANPVVLDSKENMVSKSWSFQSSCLRCSWRLACPLRPEPSASTFEQDTVASGEVAATCCCADGMLSIQPGQSAKELAPDYGDGAGLYRHCENRVQLEGNILSATFYLRELPEELTFRREGVEPNFSEYSWLVQIDVDGLPEGFHSNDLHAQLEFCLYQDR